MSERAKRIRALRLKTYAPLVRCITALDACGGEVEPAVQWLLMRGVFFSNPPPIATWSHDAVAAVRAADRRVAVLVHVRSPTTEGERDDAVYRVAKRAAAAALRARATDAAALFAGAEGATIARACAAAGVTVQRLVRVEAGEGGVLAASTGLTGEHAVVVEVAARVDDVRVTRFADWLAVRANLCGARWLRRGEVPDGRRAGRGDVLEAQWSGAHEGTVAEMERRLAAEVEGLRMARLVRLDSRDEIRWVLPRAFAPEP